MNSSAKQIRSQLIMTIMQLRIRDKTGTAWTKQGHKGTKQRHAGTTQTKAGTTQGQAIRFLRVL